MVCAVLAATVSLPLGAATEKIDYEAINKIKQQGLTAATSQVMDVASWLTDVHGPRLTGSAGTQKAGEWAAAKLKEWGLTSVALEPWTDKNNQFAYGWTNDKFYLAAVAPQAFPIPGTPTAWTPGTNGLVRGDVVLVTETTQDDLQKYAGKAQGQVDPDAGGARRRGVLDAAGDADDAGELARDGARMRPRRLSSDSPTRTPAAATLAGGRGGFGQGGFNRNDWFKSEGAAGLLSTAPRGHGRLHDRRRRPHDRRVERAPAHHHRGRAVRPARADGREERPRHALKPTSRTPTRRTRRCSTWWARSAGPTRRTKS